jgi:hypothetical protein
MTQNPGQWGPQGGYPPQGPGGGYPPAGQGGYPQPQPPPGFPPQQGGYPPQGTYPPQGGYPPQQPPPGYGQQPPPGYGQPGGEVPPGGAGYPPAPGGPAPKKSPGLIIGIVVAAVVLLAAIGGIIMVLNRNGSDQPPPVSITPTNTAPPTEQPTPGPTESTTTEPTDSPQPSPNDTGSQPPAGGVDLGNGITLAPASGWEVQKTGKGVAQLSNGQSVFLGQVIQAEANTNPGQLCDAWHRKVAEGTSNGKFQEAKATDVGTSKLSAATCLAQVTVSNGQGSGTVLLFSLASVRTSDGVTVIGTASFPPDADTEKLNTDFSAMVNSMLRSQANG